MATKPVHPGGDGEGTLGHLDFRWLTLYLSGALSDGTKEKTVAEIADHIDDAVGTSFPSSPSSGDLFYHATYKMLFEYENSKWNPIINFGSALNLYVDTGSGSDAAGKGFASGANATATIQYCWDNCVPAIFNGVITINVAAGTYSETLIFAGKTPGASTASITLLGTLSSQDTGTADADSTTQALEDDGKGWSVDEHVGRLVRITGGTANGQEYFIRANDADTLNLGGRFPVAPDDTSTYEIDVLSTIVSPGAGNIGLRVNNQSQVTIKYIEFSGGAFGAYVESGSRSIVFRSCEFDTQTSEGISIFEFSSVDILTAYVHAAGIVGIRLQSAYGTISGAYVLGCNTSDDSSRGGIVLLRSSYTLFARCYIDGNNRMGIYCRANSSILFGTGSYISDILNHDTAGDYGVLTQSGAIAIGTSSQTYTNNDTDYLVQEEFVDTANEQTVAGKKTFTTLPETDGDTPSTDNQFATKKYVDDEVGGAGGGGNNYLPFEMRLGVPETNLEKIDIRQGRSGQRLYVKRTHLTADGSTSSDLYMMVQLPSWFDGSFYDGNNIFLDVYKSDADGDCSVTLTVLDEAGDPDDGVNAVDITPNSNVTWEQKSDQLTETGSAGGYNAGDWIIIKITVTLIDQNDAIWIGPAYLRLN